MPLLLDDLRDLVRSETGNDEDTQITDTQIGTWFWLAYGQLQRELSASFPDLYEKTSGETTLVNGNGTLNKPSDYSKLVRIEVKIGEVWQVVPHASKANPQLDGYVGFEEQGAAFQITPSAGCAGTYRIIYVFVPSETFPADDIPRGFEDVLIQRVIAKAQIRIGGDPVPHNAEADRVYKRMTKALKTGRRGVGPEPGLITGYGAGASYGEDWSA